MSVEDLRRKQKEKFQLTQELRNMLLYEMEDIHVPEAMDICRKIVDIGRVQEKTAEEYFRYIEGVRNGKSCEDMKKRREDHITNIAEDLRNIHEILESDPETAGSREASFYNKLHEKMVNQLDS